MSDLTETNNDVCMTSNNNYQFDSLRFILKVLFNLNFSFFLQISFNFRKYVCEAKIEYCLYNFKLVKVQSMESETSI